MQAKGRQGIPRQLKEPNENLNLNSRKISKVFKSQNQGESVFSDAQTIIKEISTM